MQCKKLLPVIRHMSAAVLFSCCSLSVLAQTKDPAEKPGSTGSITFTYLGKKTTLTTVRAKDGNVWLQQNLGSTAVAKAVDDERAYGDLFQWGRWDDGHQVREPLYSSRKQAQPNNPAGLKLSGRNPFLYDDISYWWWEGTSADKWEASTPAEVTETNGCDPCKALGNGWHLPTINEWRTLIDVEEITDGSSGIFSTVKLAFGGTRMWIGNTIESDGNIGFYWASTAFTSGGGGYFFSVSGTGINIKEGYRRGGGLSVRCMKSKQ